MSKMGAPAKIETPEELWKVWLKYERESVKNNEYINISGFCASFGGSRWYLNELKERKNADFLHTIKRIIDKISQHCIKHAQKSEKNQALNIFLLKNYGYKDKTETDLNVSGNIKIESMFDNIDDEED